MPKTIDRVVVDRRRSLLDRHRIQTEDNLFRGFINLFWMVMIFFAVTSVLRSFRHNGTILTFDLLDATMAGYVGLVWLGGEMLVLFLVHCGMWWLARPAWLPVVHVVTLWGVLWKCQSLPPLMTMAYLISAISLQMKFYSYAVSVKKRTLSDYLLHMISPTIVYTSNPPRLSRIDYRLLAEKLTGTVFCWLTAHILIERHLWPELRMVREVNDLETILLDIYPAIFIPCIAVYLLLFLMMFEFWLGALATALRLQECVFFLDWWNSCSFADFSRKWNVPVHVFIKQHIYGPLMRRTRGNRRLANFGCFLVSALLHELVMWAGLGQRRLHPPIIFFFQLLQIPLTDLGLLLSKWSPFLANMFFWFGMIFAPPLITILYIRW